MSKDDDDDDDDEANVLSELIIKANTNLFRTDKNVDTFERIYDTTYTQLQGKALKVILFYFNLLKDRE